MICISRNIRVNLIDVLNDKHLCLYLYLRNLVSCKKKTLLTKIMKTQKRESRQRKQTTENVRRSNNI